MKKGIIFPIPSVQRQLRLQYVSFVEGILIAWKYKNSQTGH